MEELTRKLIYDHKNPMIKAELSGQKLFFKASNVEEVKFTEKYQTNLVKALGHSRVERRCARARAEWCSEKNLFKVTKVVKGLLQHFGYQDKIGIFLYPEEALFLCETNRLELTLNNVTLSIQDCYELVMKDSQCNLNTFRVYKKLVLQGYRLVRYTEILKRKTKVKETKCIRENQCVDKHKLEECDKTIRDTKKFCGESSNSREKLKQNLQSQIIQNVLEQIQSTAPKIFTHNSIDVQPDYCVFLSNNKSRVNYDFNLIICEIDVLDKIKYNEKIPILYGICCGDNILFSRFSYVQLPNLAVLQNNKE